MFSPNCDKCEKPNAPVKCSQCKCMYYCDRNCQKLHWKEHKHICKALTVGHDEQRTHLAKTLEAKKVLDSDSENKEDWECAICLEHVECPVVLPCSHKFCFPCLNMHNNSLHLEGTCPLCRSEMPNNLHQYVYQNAVMFLRRANSQPLGSEQRLLHLGMAQLELRKLPTADVESSAELKFCVGDIHLSFGEFEVALEVYNSLKSRIYKKRMLTNLHINISEAYINLNQFESAKLALRDAMTNCEETDAVFSRQIFANFARCTYELGQLEESIRYGEYVIEMNRHYEEAYTYVALAHKAMGNLEEAVRTMQRAVVYETPWDPVNVQKVKELAAQYTRERDEAAAAATVALETTAEETVAAAGAPQDIADATSPATGESDSGPAAASEDV